MNTNEKISAKQLKGLIVTTIIGVGILSLPSELANIMGLDGWIPIILTGIIMIGMAVIVVKIFEYYPNMDIFQISKASLGTVLSVIFQIILLIQIIISLTFVSRVLGEVIKAFLLDVTPIEVIIFTFILVTTYISRCGIDVIGRMGFFIYPIILGFVVLLFVITVPKANLSNLLPVFQSDIKALPKGLMVGFISFGGFEILLFSIPYVEDKDRILKSSLLGIGLIILVYLSIFVLATSQLGINQLKRLNWVTLSLVKEIDLPGLFLENLDGIVTTLWVLVAFGTLASIYYSSGKILANLFKTKQHELFILPLIPIIYTLSLIPQSSTDKKHFLANLLQILQIVGTFIFPIIIFIIGRVKNRRNNN